MINQFDIARSNQAQMARIFPPQAGPSPSEKTYAHGLNFDTSEGHRLVLTDAIDPDDIDVATTGWAEIRLLGSMALSFLIAIRFHDESRVTPWFRTPYSWRGDPGKRRPLSVQDAALLPRSACRLDVSFSNGENNVVRQLVIDPRLALALNTRVATSRDAKDGLGWRKRQADILSKLDVGESPDPRSEVVGYGVEAGQEGAS